MRRRSFERIRPRSRHQLQYFPVTTENGYAVQYIDPLVPGCIMPPRYQSMALAAAAAKIHNEYERRSRFMQGGSRRRLMRRSPRRSMRR